MKRRQRVICAAVLCCLLLAPLGGRAASSVVSTPEASGDADSIYIAGNPSWYPVEYYNPVTGCYEGLLPMLLERISQRTGLNFTYIRSGDQDQRLRLAQNGQVELVSGCTPDGAELEDDSITAGSTFLTLTQGGEEISVCFAYTEIAGDELRATLEEALAGISDRELAEIAVSFAAEHGSAPWPRWLLPAAAAVLVLLVGIIIVLAVQRRKYRRAAISDKWSDAVTGIGSKEFFTEQFEKRLPDQYRGLYSVIFFEFDIVRVNQYYGETEAEEQLRFAANELLSSIGNQDIAARVSGGGFAVARPSNNRQEAQAWTAALLRRLNQYNEKYGKDYHPDFHAGIYMMEPSDRNAEAVLYNARHACRLAVSRNTDLAFSDTALLNTENEQRQLKKRMLDAIDNGEFKMFLQFVVHAEDGTISGAEALSRWEHPQKGLLSPGAYIELMESEKVVAALDLYIFEQACRQLADWKQAGRDLSISCNLTRLTLSREDFVSQLQTISGRYFFNHFNLVLEITEDAMENNKEIAFRNVSKCKEMGFRIALDDTGSGYTSFSDLRDYPIDVVKIDRSILNSAVNQRGIALLSGMIALAHSLGMQVLCEGVETEEQAAMLRRLNCNYIQGYYFYRALPREEANRYLKEHPEASDVSVR